MATTHNYNDLTNAVEIRKDELIVKGSLGAESLKKGFDIYPNLKGRTIIPGLDTVVEFQDGAKCTFEPNGSDTWSEVALDPRILKVDKEWCFRTVNQKFEAWDVKVAIGLETAPYEDKFIDNQLGAINEALDKVIWQGNEAAGVTGITQQLEGITSVDGGGEIRTAVDNMVKAINVKAFKAGEDGKYRIYMGHTKFAQYVQALNAECCGKIGLIDLGSLEELAYPGDSRVILTPVIGLEDSAYIFGAPNGSLAYGTDVEGSENIFRFKQDEKNDTFFLKVAFTAATAVKMPFYSLYATI